MSRAAVLLLDDPLMLDRSTWCSAVGDAFGVPAEQVAAVLDGAASSTTLRAGPATHAVRRLFAEGRRDVVRRVTAGEGRRSVMEAAAGRKVPPASLRPPRTEQVLTGHELAGSAAVGSFDEPGPDVLTDAVMGALEALFAPPDSDVEVSAVVPAATGAVGDLESILVEALRSPELTSTPRSTRRPGAESLASVLTPAPELSQVRQMLADRGGAPAAIAAVCAMCADGRFDRIAGQPLAQLDWSSVMVVASVFVDPYRDAFTAALGDPSSPVSEMPCAAEVVHASLTWSPWLLDLLTEPPPLDGAPLDRAVMASVARWLADAAAAQSSQSERASVVRALGRALRWMLADCSLPSVRAAFGVASLAELPDDLRELLVDALGGTDASEPVVAAVSELLDEGRRPVRFASSGLGLISSPQVSAMLAFALAASPTVLSHALLAKRVVRGDWPADDFEAACATHPRVAEDLFVELVVGARRRPFRTPDWVVDRVAATLGLLAWLEVDLGTRRRVAAALGRLEGDELTALWAIVDGFCGTPDELVEVASSMVAPSSA